METAQAEQIKHYVGIVMRRKALIFTCVILAVSVGLAYYLRLPKVYQSSALLSYQQQKLNPGRMAPNLEEVIRDSVSTLTQIVTSRTSLEQIINDIGLYKDLQNKLPMEDVIEVMRGEIAIKPSKEGDTFNVSFSGSNPEQVVRVTNTLASRFIEENLRYREERASETSAYTADELQMAKEILDRKEAVMRDYKLKNYNEMPDQRANNMSRLTALQEQYQNRQESIQDLERTRVLIQDQVGARKSMIADAERLRLSLTQSQELPNTQESSEQTLIRLQQQLSQLQEKYTEKHPAIKKLTKRIASLERQILEEAGPDPGPQNQGERATDSLDSELFDLQIQLKDIGLNIKKLSKEKDDLQKMIDQYEKWVEAAPVREAEWSALTREYGELKRHYDYLVSQNLQANSALNLERKQKGSQFKIEDPARIAEKPVRPDFRKIMAIALLVGCGMGGVLALGLSQLDSSFRSPVAIEDAFGVEVICTVPYLPLKKEIIKSRLWTISGTLLLIFCASGLGAAFYYFYQQGRIII